MFRSNVLAILTAGLCLVTAQAGASAAASAAPARLEHMPYAAARKVILHYGWTPLSGGCLERSPGVCSAFPEVNVCSGVSPGFCAMVFVRRGRCLYVTTTGGQPGGEYADTQIQAVTYRPGPCRKD